MRQEERAAEEQAAAVKSQVSYGMESTVLGAGQKVKGARLQAFQNLEDVEAEHRALDRGLQQQENELDLAFNQGRENLLAAREDVSRVYGQESGALAAQKAAESTGYRADLENMRDSASDTVRGLNQALAGAVLGARQQREDLRAQASVLTAGYRRENATSQLQMSYIKRNKQTLMRQADIGSVMDFIGTGLQIGGFIAGLA
jgi:hypothetical protein